MPDQERWGREMDKTTRVVLLSIIFLVLILGLVGWGVHPRSVPHPMNEKYVTAYYHGFDLAGAPGFLGRLWGRVEFSDDDGGKWVFQYEHEGYNDFKAYYPNGNIREEGQCRVEVMGAHEQPFPDESDVRNSKCYLPDGTLGSEVTNGTGTQTHWTSKGVKIWELVLKDYVRQQHTIWFPDGQLRVTRNYREGRVHGPFKSYYQDGSVSTAGSYSFGERTGTWTRYRADGTRDSIETYEDGKLKSDEKSSKSGRASD